MELFLYYESFLNVISLFPGLCTKFWKVQELFYKNSLDTAWPEVDGGLIRNKPRGSLESIPSEGVSFDHSRPIWSNRLD
jgi:hypothetical protein